MKVEKENCVDQKNNYCNLFSNSYIGTVITQYGSKELYICRSYYFISSTMRELIDIFGCHYCDWPEKI